MGTLDDLKDPTDFAADKGGGGFIEEAVDGKHIVIGVEHFAPEVGANMMNTYVRLGTPLPQAQRSRVSGDDLAAFVQGFSDDTRKRGDATSIPPCPAQSFDASSEVIFRRTRPNDPTKIDPRRVESAILQEKGGWRDHTDGNRITTTRGDKVEVIQGNYKLLVMGRQVDEGLAAPAARTSLLNNSGGFDISGGQNDLDGDLAFASVQDGFEPSTVAPTRNQADLAVAYDWTPDSDGKTFSWTQTTRVGHDGPKATDRGNYRIINHNYVDYQEDNYGTADGRVSQIVSTTYANEMDTTLDVTDCNTTKLSGDRVENENRAHWILTHNAVAAMSEVDVATAILLSQITMVGVGNAYFGGVATLAGVVLDVHLGPHIDGHVGPHIDSHLGVHTETHLGVHLDVHLATHTDVHMGGHKGEDTVEEVKLRVQDKFTVNMSTGVVTVTDKISVDPRPQCVFINGDGSRNMVNLSKE